MGQNALKICNASDYTGSEILKVFKQVSGNKTWKFFFVRKVELLPNSHVDFWKRTQDFQHVCVSRSPQSRVCSVFVSGRVKRQIFAPL